MANLAIALDLGTSGFRAQAVDLQNNETLSTVITTQHPLPGANVMDHLHFALEMGGESAATILMTAVNRVIAELRIDTSSVVRLGVCGNPAQLSLFQRMEIRDLAYAGQRKLDGLGVVAPSRAASIRPASDFAGLQLPAVCDVLIPPAVGHEVGADALALIMKSGILEKDQTAIAIDFGTNAEMALVHKGVVYSGSTAAGPALEGQHISCGMLAVPGVIADIVPEGGYHRLVQLDEAMMPVPGALIDLQERGVVEPGNMGEPIGITGTGTIAVLHQAMVGGLLSLPRIVADHRRLHLGQELFLTEEDIVETGKAIGALRAGYITLCQLAGIGVADVDVAYMSGAAGTYVDARKARDVGMVPPQARLLYQIGNTSLAMARDIVVDSVIFKGMSALADTLRRHHCMFARSPVFKKLYVLEFSYWTEGMPLTEYRRYLQRYNITELPEVQGEVELVRPIERDIEDLGRCGLSTIDDIGQCVVRSVEGCLACLECARNCPGRALSVDGDKNVPEISLRQALCNGVACRRCEQICPVTVFDLRSFF